jgi:hypothetical protein
MYNEHTLHAGVVAMRKAGLVQGRMTETKNTEYPNAIVGTVESGDFWYGDLEMADLSKLHDVAKEIGESVKLFHSTLSEPLTISV